MKLSQNFGQKIGSKIHVDMFFELPVIVVFQNEPIDPCESVAMAWHSFDVIAIA